MEKNVTLKIIIEGAPRTKKNHNQILVNRRTGKRFIKPSVQYEQYELEAGFQIPGKYRIGINCPVNVKCLYYMPTRGRVDLVNLLEATDDILVKNGVLKDDNSKIVAAHDGSRVLYSKENPRAEIYITRMEG